mgnify:CR=1 FL=1
MKGVVKSFNSFLAYEDIVKNFTDALSMVIYQAVSLEKNHNIHPENRIAAKIYARYLLSLNLIDELGSNTHQLEKSAA